MNRFARKLLATTLLTASLGIAHAAVEVAGIGFRSQETLDSGALMLNGAGLRTRLTFKVYAMGLYVRTPATDATALLQDSGEKRIRIVMIRDLEAKQFADAMRAGLERNHDAAALASLKPSTDALLAAVMGSGDARSGTELILDQLADGSTRLLVNGQARSDIADPALYPALLRIWIGDRPADADLKEDLLNRKK
ncbi:chalcone isomerase family protein [Thauera sp. 63]|uniref:chalcone isomerase family protein n=1 Tax=Thauera sp. 63 TaxID=497321 RepID=UPI0002CEC9F6|nr:chalcone isomerase family protein [Thauera sp. 63]ENO76980.1 chalcone isomerase [Thauera sp. 63]